MRGGSSAAPLNRKGTERIMKKKSKAKEKLGDGSEAEVQPNIGGVTSCQLDIPAACLIPARWNTRGEIAQEDVADLVASIKSLGLIQRISVREGTLGGVYTILAGHRRFAACMIAGLDPIPCVVVSCDDKQAHMITAVENLHRKDLTAIQEAESVEDLLNQGMTAGDIAHQTGRHIRWVYRRASILTLTQQWRDAANTKGLCAAFLEEISRMPNNTQDAVFHDIAESWRSTILENGGNVGQIKQTIAEQTRELKTAPWAKRHPDWCANCDRCSNSRANLFDETEVGDGAKCLDTACWDQRKASMVEEQLAELTEKHGKVQTASDSEYRYCYGKLQDAKSRADKTHATPVLIVDGENVGRVVWTAGKGCNGDDKSGTESKQPTIDEKRKAWVVRRVRDMIDASRKEGSLDNPFVTFENLTILKILSLTGTDHSASLRNAAEWGSDFYDQAEDGLKIKLWGRVAPVLMSRLNYSTITGCDCYYTEAVEQASHLFGINKEDLDAEAEEAIKDKRKG